MPRPQSMRSPIRRPSTKMPTSKRYSSAESVPAYNESQALIVTAGSDNPALIPNPTVNYIGGQSVGSIQYTPLFNQYGVAHITVTVTDAGFNGSFGDEDDASISQIIDAVVNSVNDPPIAAADSFTVSINSSANTLNVLTNDSIAPDSGEVRRNLCWANQRRGQRRHFYRSIKDTVFTTGFIRNRHLHLHRLRWRPCR